MTDLERRLSAVLVEKAQEFEAEPIRLPPEGGLRRQVRQRQLATAVIVSVTLIALVAGSIGVIEFVSRASRRANPGQTPVGTATFTTGGVTITYPEAWTALDRTGSGPTYVGDPPPGAVAVLPILQVSSFPVSYPGAPICPLPAGGSATFPDDGVLLYVEQVLRAASPGIEPPAYPVPAGDVHVAAPAVDPCRGGEPVWFRVSAEPWPRGPIESWRLEAFLVAGDRASQLDRDRLLAAFEHITVDRMYTPVVPTGPKVTVLQGVFDGSAWRVVAQATESGPCAGLIYDGGTQIPPGGGAGNNLLPLPDFCPSYLSQSAPGVIGAYRFTFRRQDGSTVFFVWGEVTSEAASVAVELPPGGKALPASLGAVPEDVLQGSAPFSLFALAMGDDITHALIVTVVFDGSGREIGRASIDCTGGNLCS